MLPLLLLAALVLGVASFLLGWFAANGSERLALHRRQTAIARWVADTWPDEAAAYHYGHTEGYQQGILHSPELVADSESQTYA